MLGVFISVLCVGFVFGKIGNITTKQRTPDMLCKEGNYLVNDGDKFFCVECPDFPYGQELEVKCDVTKVQPSSMDIECLLCKKGFFKAKQDYTSCEPCTQCPNHFKVKVPCDGDSDTICSDNECEDGFEYDLNLIRCVSKSPLQPTQMEKETVSITLSECKSEAKRRELDKLKKVLNIVRSLQVSLMKKKAPPVTFNGCKCELDKLKRVLDKLNFMICMLSFTSSFSVAIFAFVCCLGCMMRKASLI